MSISIDIPTADRSLVAIEFAAIDPAQLLYGLFRLQPETKLAALIRDLVTMTIDLPEVPLNWILLIKNAPARPAWDLPSFCALYNHCCDGGAATISLRIEIDLDRSRLSLLSFDKTSSLAADLPAGATCVVLHDVLPTPVALEPVAPKLPRFPFADFGVDLHQPLPIRLDFPLTPPKLFHYERPDREETSIPWRDLPMRRDSDVGACSVDIAEFILPPRLSSDRAFPLPDPDRIARIAERVVANMQARLVALFEQASPADALEMLPNPHETQSDSEANANRLSDEQILSMPFTQLRDMMTPSLDLRLAELLSRRAVQVGVQLLPTSWADLDRPDPEDLRPETEQSRSARQRASAWWDLYTDRLFAQSQGAMQADRVRPTACVGCTDYCGATHGGNTLICGIHPHGVEGDVCPDLRMEVGDV
jgi:hypothetical protein